MSYRIAVNRGRGDQDLALTVHPESVVQSRHGAGIREGVADSQDFSFASFGPGKHAEDVRIGQLSGKNASSLPDGELVREINVIAIGGEIAGRGNGCCLPALRLSETKGRGQETKNPRQSEQS